MEFLIAQGVPMRSAHEAVGKLVRECEAKRLPARGPAARAVRGGPARARAGRWPACSGVPNALAAFQSYGSTAPAEVAQQLAEWKGRLA